MHCPLTGWDTGAFAFPARLPQRPGPVGDASDTKGMTQTASTPVMDDRVSLGGAWLAGCGSALSKWNLVVLSDSGITPARVEPILASARTALGVSLPVPPPADGDPETSVHRLAMELVVLASRLWRRNDFASRASLRWTDAEVFAWIAMLAGAPTVEIGNPRVSVPGDATTLTQWRAAVPGVVGPLAYAAGLTMAEAEEGFRWGTLNAEDLAVLAGLRGWRIFSLPE